MPEPSDYYDRGGISTLDFALAKGMGIIEYGCLKYLVRWRHKHADPKDQESDLLKLIDYAQRLHAEHYGSTRKTKEGLFYRRPAVGPP